MLKNKEKLKFINKMNPPLKGPSDIKNNTQKTGNIYQLLQFLITILYYDDDFY